MTGKPMKSETPRTDALLEAHRLQSALFLGLKSDWKHHAVRQVKEVIEHARQLERELAAEREAREECRKLLHAEHDAHMQCHQRAELAESTLAAAGMPGEPKIMGHITEDCVNTFGKADPTKFLPLVLKSDYDALRAHANGLAADAKRYRWLRSAAPDFSVMIPRIHGHIGFSHQALDEKIDASLSAGES